MSSNHPEREPKKSDFWGRELSDPNEEYNLPPVMFYILVGGLAAWGFNYFSDYAGPTLAFDGDERSVQLLAPVVPTGPGVFQTRCAVCHQASGLGVPHVYPPLLGSSWLLEDVETPIRIVLLGLQGPIEVEGVTYTNAMPPFSGQLTDLEISLVLSHERSTWGNQASPVAEADVARVRAALKDHHEPWSGGAALQAARIASQE